MKGKRKENFEEEGSETCFMRYLGIKKTMMVLAKGISIQMNGIEQNPRDNLYT